MLDAFESVSYQNTLSSSNQPRSEKMRAQKPLDASMSVSLDLDSCSHILEFLAHV